MASRRLGLKGWEAHTVATAVVGDGRVGEWEGWMRREEDNGNFVPNIIYLKLATLQWYLEGKTL